MKTIISDYTFNASAKTIKFPTLANPRLEGFQLITNVTTGDIIYQFNAAAKGAALSGDVLTLDFDTTAMANSDILQIIYTQPSMSVVERVHYMLAAIVEYLRAPEWMVPLPAGKMLRVVMDNSSIMSSINQVNTVGQVTTTATVTNLTNFNTIDSRELIWNLWDTEYNTGIRNRIV